MKMKRPWLKSNLKAATEAVQARPRWAQQLAGHITPPFTNLYTMGTFSIIQRYDLENERRHKALVIKPEPAPGSKEYNQRLIRNGVLHRTDMAGLGRNPNLYAKP